MGNSLSALLFLGAGLMTASPHRNTLPSFFIANQGEAPPPVLFLAKGSGLTAYFAPREIVFSLAGGAVRMELVGTSSTATVTGLDMMPARANFLARDESHTGVPLYGALVYRQLYAGIDMRYSGNGRDLKSEFLVAPAADPARILMRYRGAGHLHIGPDGALAIPVGAQEIRESPPVAWQERKGRRVPVSCRFRLGTDGAVGFLMGAGYDGTLPLIIDPVLSSSTTLSGSGINVATSVAVDASGSAYIAGYTDSYDFPSVNPEQNSFGGSTDAFVAKFAPGGNTLVYCTYLGGTGDDRAYGIAVDSSGAAYVAGSTTSTDFPIRNPLQPRNAGGMDAFVAKLNPQGNALVYSTYLGGESTDNANGIAVDANGNVYVVGDTASLRFPATGFQKTNHGGQDGFVAKLNVVGSQLVYSTYLGGALNDSGKAIAVNSDGTAYVTGSTYSSDFPTANPFQANLGGGQDAFAARLDAGGMTLLYSTYLGGSGGTTGYPEAGGAIAVDAAGNAYVAGVTSSANFPVLQAVQTALAGSMDAFVSKFNAAGSLVYSTYLGGASVDYADAVAVDSAGNAYVAGYTYSTDFPVAAALQSSNGGSCDGFVVELSSTGNMISFATYLGGIDADTISGVALDGAGNLYVAGYTASNNFPLVNASPPVHSGELEAFVARITFSAPSVVGVAPSSGSGSSQTFSLQYSDTAGASDLSSVWVWINSSFAASAANSCLLYYSQGANQLNLINDAGAVWMPATVGTNTTLSNSSCSVNVGSVAVTRNGNTLTLQLPVTFTAAYAGAKNVYMAAYDNGFQNTSGWQTRGTWTVPAGVTLAAASVTPSSGSGISQTFSLQYSDTAGASDLSSVWVWINSSFAASAANSCLLYYSQGTNQLNLINNAGAVWMPATVGTNTTLSNGSCSVNVGSVAVTQNGNTLTLQLPVTFTAAYAGAKNVYMAAYDNGFQNTSGWQTRGTWVVP